MFQKIIFVIDKICKLGLLGEKDYFYSVMCFFVGFRLKINSMIESPRIESNYNHILEQLAQCPSKVGSFLISGSNMGFPFLFCKVFFGSSSLIDMVLYFSLHWLFHIFFNSVNSKLFSITSRLIAFWEIKCLCQWCIASEMHGMVKLYEHTLAMQLCTNLLCYLS